MEIPGKKEILSRLPDRPKYILKLYLLQVILITLFTLTVLFILDVLPSILPTAGWLKVLEPYIPPIGSMLVLAGGLSIVHITWRKRDKFISQDKKRAFQKSVKYTFTGIPIAMAGIIHMFLPVSWLAEKIFSITDFRNPLTDVFQTSIGQLIAAAAGNSNYNDMIARIVFSMLFLIIAFLTMFRTIFVFGIDNAGMVYLYYPEESKIIDHKIHSIVRHPLYVSVFLLMISALISNFSLISVITSIIFILSFSYQIFGIEEKELIERFGEGFKEYRKEVPALIIHPRNWGKFFKFLLGKEI
ncbi:MAG: methyltransferase family protein [Candidatus Heimdallarchaeaceae archaeon]